MEFPRLVHPSTCLVAGPTGSGKTNFVRRLLRHEMFTPAPSRVIYCFGAWQQAFEEMTNVDFIDGLPGELHEVRDALIIIDDLMNELSNDKRLASLFTRGSHHRKLSVIFIVQNLFHQGTVMRSIHLNSHYLVLYKNPRDKSQIMHLAKQIMPGKSRAFIEIFNDATKMPFSYLFVDLRPETDENLRLRTGIFPPDKNYVYQPR